METKELKITFTSYANIDELPQEEKELLLSAMDATAGSYSPYSGFSVGAAVRMANGEITPQLTYPCGACRQVLSETQSRSGNPVKIIVGSANEILLLDSVESLLPFAFDNYPSSN